MFKDKIIGKFEGILDCNNKTVYIVLEDIPSPLVKTVANTYFKVKKSELLVQRIYMDSYDSDEFSFEEYPGCIKAIAVSKRRNP